jgi:hypothetical protein
MCQDVAFSLSECPVCTACAVAFLPAPFDSPKTSWDRHHLGERSRQRRLAVVNVADGADVDVWLRALELLLHPGCSLL